MTTESIAITVIVAIIAAALGYFISRAKSAKVQASQQLQVEQQQKQIDSLSGELEETRIRFNHTEENLHAHQTRLAVTDKELQSAMTRKQELAQELEQARNLSESRQAELSEVKQTLSEVTASREGERKRVSELTEHLTQSRNELNTQRAKTEEVEMERNRLNEALATTQSKLQSEQKRSGELVEQITQLNEALQQQREKTAEVEAERNKLAKEYATLQTSLTEKEQHFEKQLKALDEQKSILKQEFQVMANEIMDAKGKAFSAQSTESINAMLNPFKQQLESFRKRVDEVHTHQTSEHSSLRTELTKLHELNQRITDEANNLTNALKNNKKIQGNWGELQVEMILDQSGLRKGYEYEREANCKDEDNNNLRPDFIVNLPEGKHVIIDSKVSLNAYNDYVAAETDEEREVFLKAHVQAVRKHIDDLFKKDYSKLQGLNSPDFIFMFMPIEPAFIAAFEYDPGLFNNAFEKHIVVVTPTTLLATLRTISNLWSIERQNQSARTLADQAGKVYDKLRVFVEKMDKLGNQLSTAQKTYDEAHNTLTGSRSLTSTVQKFVDLGVRVKKELPASVTESALLDDDTITSIEHQPDDLFETESEKEIA